MKFKELLNLPDAELRRQILDLEAELHALQVKARLSQLKTTHQISAVRHNVARLRTRLTQLAREAGKPVTK